MNNMRQLPIDSRYFVTEEGNVYSTCKGELKKLKPVKGDSTGHTCVTINKKRYYVHYLILLTFVGDRPESSTQIRHKNGIPTDNRLVNLEYCTSSKNMQDITFLKESNRRLFVDTVLSIKKDILLGEDSQVSIAAKYGVHARTVSHIKHGSRYSYVNE